MPTFPNATALTSSTVTTGTVFPCSESAARNEITASNLIAGLSILQGSPAVTAPLIIDPATLSPVVNLNPASLSYANNDPVSTAASGGTADSFTASGTARPLFKTNLLDTYPALNFDGSNDTIATTTGGASLNGSFTVIEVRRHSSITGDRNGMAWGDASNGQRRSPNFKLGTSHYAAFIGQFADLASCEALANSTWYILATTYNATTGIVKVYVNGLLAAADVPSGSLVAYSSAALRYGSNPGGAEFFAGDLAYLAAFGSALSDQNLVGVTRWLAARFPSVTNTPAAPYPVSIYNGTNVLSPAPIYQDANGNLCIGGPATLKSYNTLGDASWVANVSINGMLAANAPQGRGVHSLRTSAQYQNVLTICNLHTQGTSGITFAKPTDLTKEHGAVGVVPAGASFTSWGRTSVPGAFAEASGQGSTYGNYAITQTDLVNLYHKKRSQWRYDTYSIEDYDHSYAEPSVNGATTGLVCLRGKPVTSVANNGTLDTNITTGSTQVGIVIVKDTTSGKGAIYQLVNATLTAIGTPDAQFTTTLDNASTVNIYNSSGQLVIQNKTGGALNLTASYYGA